MWSTRLSADERAAFDRKAAARGMKPGELLRAWIAMTDGGALAPVEAAAPVDVWATVEAALAKHEAASLGGLVPVAPLVRALAPVLAMADVHEALFAASARGVFDLWPESGGGGMLSAEDAALCPAGPRGTVLSYVRRR
jgi:hypothetical protein